MHVDEKYWFNWFFGLWMFWHRFDVGTMLRVFELNVKNPAFAQHKKLKCEGFSLKNYWYLCVYALINISLLLGTLVLYHVCLLTTFEDHMKKYLFESGVLVLITTLYFRLVPCCSVYFIILADTVHSMTTTVAMFQTMNFRFTHGEQCFIYSYSILKE